MRENNLLSPHRCRRRGGNPHDGEIITHAPNLMWGTDGVRVFTVDDGWGWISPPSSIGTPSVSAGMSASAATASPPCSRSPWGLPGCMARPRPARLGAGLADGSRLPVSVGPLHQPDQVLGHPAVLRFVAEPQTNGVAERFNRTLKEQIIHGRIYRNIAELRDAVRDFVELYNAQWIVEKNGYLSPAQARQAWHAAISIRPAA